MSRQASGVGKGGKSLNDRELAAEVRTKALEAIKAVLMNDDEATAKWSEYKKQMVLKLSASILPRLNEVTGQDGGAIQIEGVELSFRE